MRNIPVQWEDSDSRDVTDVGTEVSQEEREERPEGGREDSQGEEGWDVHLAPGEADQAPAALPREAAGRDGSLLSTAGK